MCARRVALLSQILVSGITSHAQVPRIDPNGIVNGASFQYTAETGNVVAPGSFASIFGQDLATETASAGELPLPVQLAGVTVTFGGVVAPIGYVSPTQINVQVPSGLLPTGVQVGRKIGVVVTSGNQSSLPVTVNVIPRSPGVFTVDASGCGSPVVLAYGPDGSTSLNSPLNALQPGDWISVFFTGYGVVPNQPPDGYPSPASPAMRDLPLGVELGSRNISPLVSKYGGKAPGSVAVDQIDIQVPLDAPEGCSIPLRLLTLYSSSQPVPLSIRQGRGRCMPAPVSLADVEWVRTLTSNLSASEYVNLRFNSADVNSLPPLQPVIEGAVGTLIPPSGPSCPDLMPLALGTGSISLQGPTLSTQVPQPIGAGGETKHALPAGTISAGSYTITATGGANLGAFSSTLSIPPAIQMSTTFTPGQGLVCSQPLTIRWTGGDDSSVVTLSLRVRSGEFSQQIYYTAVAASAHEATLKIVLSIGLPVPCPAAAEIVVTQTPRPENAQQFDAQGLSQPGRHWWKYEFRFPGLHTGA
jgi:uncharacterized protein (TIGR03437 family)